MTRLPARYVAAMPPLLGGLIFVALGAWFFVEGRSDYVAALGGTLPFAAVAFGLAWFIVHGSASRIQGVGAAGLVVGVLLVAGGLVNVTSRSGGSSASGSQSVPELLLAGLMMALIVLGPLSALWAARLESRPLGAQARATLHAGLRLSYRTFYVQSGREDLVEQVPEVESQDAAYARWQAGTADRSVVEHVDARYRQALGLENRAYAHRWLVRSIELLVGLAVAAAVFALLIAVAAGVFLVQGTARERGYEQDAWLLLVGGLFLACLLAGLGYLVLRALPKPAKAIRAHESLIAEHPGFANADLRLAYLWQIERPRWVVRWRAQRIAFEQSLAATVRASTTDPQFEMAHFCAGVVLKLLGRPDEAAAAYRKAIALNPRFAAARANLGLILVDSNDFEGAVAEFSAMLRDFPDARNAKTNLHLAEKRFTRAGHTQAEFQKLVAFALQNTPIVSDVMPIVEAVVDGALSGKQSAGPR